MRATKLTAGLETKAERVRRYVSETSLSLGPEVQSYGCPPGCGFAATVAARARARDVLAATRSSNSIISCSAARVTPRVMNTIRVR